MKGCGSKGGKRATEIQQLEVWKDDNRDGSAHGGTRTRGHARNDSARHGGICGFMVLQDIDRRGQNVPHRTVRESRHHAHPRYPPGPPAFPRALPCSDLPTRSAAVSRRDSDWAKKKPTKKEKRTGGVGFDVGSRDPSVVEITQTKQGVAQV